MPARDGIRVTGPRDSLGRSRTNVTRKPTSLRLGRLAAVLDCARLQTGADLLNPRKSRNFRDTGGGCARIFDIFALDYLRPVKTYRAFQIYRDPGTKPVFAPFHLLTLNPFARK